MQEARLKKHLYIKPAPMDTLAQKEKEEKQWRKNTMQQKIAATDL